MSLKPATTGATLGTSAVAVYTPATGDNARIEGLTLTNTSAGAVTVNLWRGAATTANASLQAKSLIAGQSYVVKELIGHWIADGDGLFASASVAGVIALVLSTLEFAIPA